MARLCFSRTARIYRDEKLSAPAAIRQRRSLPLFRRRLRLIFSPVVFLYGNRIDAGEPAMEIDICTAFGAEGAELLDRKLATDRAGFLTRTGYGI
jgi:hypothetical protein